MYFMGLFKSLFNRKAHKDKSFIISPLRTLRKDFASSAIKQF